MMKQSKKYLVLDKSQKESHVDMMKKIAYCERKCNLCRIA